MLAGGLLIGLLHIGLGLLHLLRRLLLRQGEILPGSLLLGNHLLLHGPGLFLVFRQHGGDILRGKGVREQAEHHDDGQRESEKAFCFHPDHLLLHMRCKRAHPHGRTKLPSACALECL